MAATLVGKGLGSNMTTAVGTTAAGDVLLFFSSQLWPGAGSFSIKDQIGGVDTGNAWTLLTDVYTPLYGYGVCAWKCTSGARGANHRVVITDDGRAGAVGFFVRVPNATDVDVFAANTTTAAVATGTLAQALEEVLLFGVDANPGGNPTWSTTLPSPTKVAEETNNSLYTCAVLYATTTAATTSVSGNITPQAYPGKIIVAVKVSGGGGATVSPSGIATSAAYGSPTIGTTVAPAGVATAAALGAPGVGASLSPTGIATVSALGSPTLPGVAPSGIAAAAALGAPSLAVTLGPGGIVTGEAWGLPSLVGAPAAVNPSGIAASDAYGTPALGATLAPAGIATAAAYGSPTVAGAGTGVQPAGIAAADAYGTPALGATIAPAGIATAAAIGLPTVTPPGAVAPAGIASAAALGSPALGVSLAPVGIATAAAPGAPVVTPTTELAPAGIGSAAAIGSPVASLVLGPAGIATAAAYGAPAVLGTVGLAPVGIASMAAFGVPRVRAGVLDPTEWVFEQIAYGSTADRIPWVSTRETITDTTRNTYL